MLFALEIAAVLAGILLVALVVAGLISGNRSEVEMPGGETIFLPPREEPRQRRRWRITIERD